MARIVVPDENRCLTTLDEIQAFLEPHGIWYEHWPVEGRLSKCVTDEQILQEFSSEIQQLKQRGGFLTADVINVHPDTPNLEALLAKFDKEHTHSEDEVRFTVEGRGLFHIRPDSQPVFAVQVESGDMINVPCGTKHWFNLCADRHIRCIRFFENVSGWTPNYVDQGVHPQYQPLCFGQSDFEPKVVIDATG